MLALENVPSASGCFPRSEGIELKQRGSYSDLTVPWLVMGMNTPLPQ